MLKLTKFNFNIDRISKNAKVKKDELKAVSKVASKIQEMDSTTMGRPNEKDLRLFKKRDASFSRKISSRLGSTISSKISDYASSQVGSTISKSLSAFSSVLSSQIPSSTLSSTHYSSAIHDSKFSGKTFSSAVSDFDSSRSTISSIDSKTKSIQSSVAKSNNKSTDISSYYGSSVIDSKLSKISPPRIQKVTKLSLPGSKVLSEPSASLAVRVKVSNFTPNYSPSLPSPPKKGIKLINKVSIFGSKIQKNTN